jgi:hypothetical protein
MTTGINVNDFKTRLQKIILINPIKVSDIKDFLTPVALYVDSPTFNSNISIILDVITRDRNGDNQFDIEDLKLMSKDPIAITSLVSSIFLIICGIPGLKIKYDQGAADELVLKLLSYVFLVIVPGRIGKPLSKDDKMAIIDIVIAMYQTAMASQISLSKINDYFKTNGWCGCCVVVDKGDVIDEHLPKYRTDLSNAMAYNRSKLHVKIEPEIKEINKPIKVNPSIIAIKEPDDISRTNKKSMTM